MGGGKGSCWCGKVSYTWAGEPLNKAICHCNACQKISGSAYTTNLVVPSKDFNVTGTPKSYSTKADSGRTVTSVFCGECGSPLWREGEMTDPDAKILRAGTLDGGKEALNGAKPIAELYVKDRAEWLGAQPGTEGAQFDAMPPSQ